MTVTVADQIRCVRRELAMRQRVYPGWVAKGKMKQEEADRELAAMQAVHDSLRANWIDITLQEVPKDGKLYRARSADDRGVVFWDGARGMYGWVAEGKTLKDSNITHWAKFDGGDQP
jgi:hypothetical protein